MCCKALGKVETEIENYLELSQAFGMLWASSNIIIEFYNKGAISSEKRDLLSKRYVYGIRIKLALFLAFF